MKVEHGSVRDGERESVEMLQRTLESVRVQSAGRSDDAHFQFKITHVAPGSTDPVATFTTNQFFSLTFRAAESIVEHHAEWIVRWRSEGGTAKIADIRVPKFVRTTTKRARPLFSDCTQSALAANPSYARQLAYGLNHWLGRLPVRAMLNHFGTPGLAVGDVDGDGRDDLYLCQEPGLPNRLFLQNADGTARDVSVEWGVDWINDSRAPLLVDLDNDGDQDLVVSTHGSVVVARNDGGRRFEVAAALPTSGSTASLSAADYNNDGRLDLYVCGYAPDNFSGLIGAAMSRFVFHDAENGAANSFFQNETLSGGDLAFRDVTNEVGLDQNNQRWSLAASWEDYADDGDQDLYVANDYGRNNLYRNEGGRFVDVAAQAGVEDSASGMSVAWGDYDRDGRVDLYVSNMFSAAGNRIASQQEFKADSPEAIRRRFRRFARGNSLFRNSAEGFDDVSIKAGVTLGRWAWSSNFIDVNNDSWPDLVVANGYISSDTDSGDL